MTSRLDFWINSNHRWGVELMYRGDGNKDHLSRFGKGGQYDKLNAKDYRVVDFRREPHYVCVALNADCDCASVIFPAAGSRKSCTISKFLR